MRALRHCPVLAKSAAIASCGIAMLACAPVAWAQQSQSAPAFGPDEPPPDPMEIIVVGGRYSAVNDIAPLSTLDADAIAATGATNMGELLQAIRGSTQAADGAEPIFLLNAQRVSGYQEIGTLPPEAIEKVEVLPEQAALKFGFPPTRRVVNFITKRRFRQIEARGAAGGATRGGRATASANLGLTRLHDDARLTLALEYRRVDPLWQSERDIAPDPDLPFDAIGNVTGVSGEIDPALSAAAGRAVRIASVPDAPAARTMLAGYAAGADRPRRFDLGSYKTLAPGNDALKAEAVLANRIGKTLAGSVSLSAEQVRERSVYGPASAILLVPGTNPYSPFAGPVLLNRYLTETGLLGQQQTMTSLHAGFLLRGAVSGWRWDVTAMLDQKQVEGRTDRNIDPLAANAAIAAGANPFAPLDPGLLTARLTDQSRLTTRMAGVKAVATHAPFRLPAGPVTVTATVEIERLTTDSANRGSNPFDLRLGRTRTEGGVAASLPLASRREGVLPFIGDLSVNASFRARRVGGFGSLHDTSYGMSWAPFEGLQLLATVKHSAAAPDMARQSAPVVRVANVPVYDYANGRTELVTLIQGGSPGLEAERRLTRSLTLTLKPFAKRELRLSATYEATAIRNQTGTVYALNPRTEAILPDLFVRDPAGRLVSAAFRPINFNLERVRTLNFTLNANGKVGKPGTGPDGKPMQPPGYYAGMGPSIKFSDRLQLRPGTPALDVLAGDTINGGGTPRYYGYFYGGINHLGNGMKIDGWYGGANRVRGVDPAGDIRFSPIFLLNMGGTLSVHHFLRAQRWTQKLQLKLDVSNVLDMRRRVRDGNGRTPNRYQADHLDPIGRTVSVSLRKLF